MAKLLLPESSPHYEILTQVVHPSEENKVFVWLEWYEGHKMVKQAIPVIFDGQTQKCRVREQDLLDLGWTLQVDSAYVPGGNENG